MSCGLPAILASLQPPRDIRQEVALGPFTERHGGGLEPVNGSLGNLEPIGQLFPVEHGERPQRLRFPFHCWLSKRRSVLPSGASTRPPEWGGVLGLLPWE